MKKLNTFLLLSALALFTIVSSCKKYDDGPSFSLLTKKQRISRSWQLKSVTSGGFSVEASDDDSHQYRFDFKKNGDAVITWDGVTSNGSWSFTDGKEDLTIVSGSNSVTFEIHRLTNKELWLEEDDNNSGDDDYVYKFESN